MAKTPKFGVLRATITETSIKAKLARYGTDTKFEIELAFEDYPDVEKNVEAFARYLADKAEQILGE